MFNRLLSKALFTQECSSQRLNSQNTSKGLIPLVDLTGVELGSTQSNDATKRAAKEIHEAFSTIGFVYLLNHGIPESQIQEARKKADAFFALPNEAKAAYTRQGNSNHGWVPLEMETLNPERGAGDYKEAFNITPKANLAWPDNDVDEFSAATMALFDSSIKLTKTVLYLMAVGLQLEDHDIFLKAHDFSCKENSTSLRCLHYPPLPSNYELKPRQVRCGEHSDYGSITLLFQDGVGGLEVMNRNREYQAATPVEGAVLVNIGDLMQRWTGDVLVSTKHRVLVPEEEALKRTVRRSMAFFVQPDDNCLIQCIDGSDKYEPITSLDFLNLMFSKTY